MSQRRVAAVVIALASTLPACARRAPAPTAAHAPHARESPDPTVGVHGMLLFGDGRAYLSHLPLFRAPHDRQLILAARLLSSDSARRAGAPDPHAAYVADRRASGERVYTVEPERYALAAIAGATAGAPARFRATVYRGHFERGGTPLLRDVTVEVERAIVARQLGGPLGGPLGVGEADAGRTRYVLFGEPGELYVAHRVGGAPSYDQVVRVALTGAAPDSGSLARGVEVDVEARDGRPLRERPLRDGERVVLRAGGAGARPSRFAAEVARVLYTEFDDLAAAPAR